MLQACSPGRPESGLHLFRFLANGPVRELLAVSEDGGVWPRKPDEKMHLRSISSSRAEVRQRETRHSLCRFNVGAGKVLPFE